VCSAISIQVIKRAVFLYKRPESERERETHTHTHTLDRLLIPAGRKNSRERAHTKPTLWLGEFSPPHTRMLSASRLKLTGVMRSQQLLKRQRLHLVINGKINTSAQILSFPSTIFKSKLFLLQRYKKD
jgi:hypothetical protein